ncbi:hypothetical protein QVD99_000458 [Batrachochytrium dendrobatidis]|nr:hypothetical protein QVD99_000458 [Batrachochytrium dendrobatidis]
MRHWHFHESQHSYTQITNSLPTSAGSLHSQFESLVNSNRVDQAAMVLDSWNSNNKPNSDSASHSFQSDPALETTYIMLISAYIAKKDTNNACMWLQKLDHHKKQSDFVTDIQTRIDLWHQCFDICINLDSNGQYFSCNHTLNSTKNNSLDICFDIFCQTLLSHDVSDYQIWTDGIRNSCADWTLIFLELVHYFIARNRVDGLQQMVSVITRIGIFIHPSVGCHLIQGFVYLKSVDIALSLPQSLSTQSTQQHSKDSLKPFADTIMLNNALIRALVTNGYISEAIQVFTMMDTNGWTDSCTFGILMREAARENDFIKVLMMYSDIKKRGIKLMFPELAVVIYAMVKTQKIDEALNILKNMTDEFKSRTDPSAKPGSENIPMSRCSNTSKEDIEAVRSGFNSIIYGLCRLGLRKRAQDMLIDLQKLGISPNGHTISLFLTMYISLQRLQKTKPILAAWFKRESNSRIRHTSSDTLTRLQKFQSNDNQDGFHMLILYLVYSGYHAMYSGKAIARHVTSQREHYNQKTSQFRYAGHPLYGNQQSSNISTTISHHTTSSLSTDQKPKTASYLAQDSVGKQFVQDAVKSIGADYSYAASAVILFHAKHQCRYFLKSNEPSHFTPLQSYTATHSLITRKFDKVYQHAVDDVDTLKPMWDVSDSIYCTTLMKDVDESLVTSCTRGYHYQQAENMFAELQHEGKDLVPMVHDSLVSMYRLSGEIEKVRALDAMTHHKYMDESVSMDHVESMWNFDDGTGPLSNGLHPQLKDSLSIPFRNQAK